MPKASLEHERTHKCPECGSRHFVQDYDTGETVCGDCGLVVLEQMMDKGPEWRAFPPEERDAKCRVGIPTSYAVYDKGHSTTFFPNRDAFGRPLSPKTKRQMWRLRKWQIRSRVHSSKDRNLSEAMAILDRLSGKVIIPRDVKEMGAVIYRKALDKELVRGRSISVMAAASLYAACRRAETPKTLKEVSEESLVEKKDIARCYRFLLRELDIKMPIPDPITYLSKIAERTRMSGDAQGIAVRIIKLAKRKRRTSGKDPSGVAAAASYFGSELMYEIMETFDQDNPGSYEKITQEDFSKAAEVTEVTVRNRYKELKREISASELAHELLKFEGLKKYNIDDKLEGIIEDFYKL